jgi:hypothetical protein
MDNDKSNTADADRQGENVAIIFLQIIGCAQFNLSELCIVFHVYVEGLLRHSLQRQYGWKPVRLHYDELAMRLGQAVGCIEYIVMSLYEDKVLLEFPDGCIINPAFWEWTYRGGEPRIPDYLQSYANSLIPSKYRLRLVDGTEFEEKE